MLLIRHAQSEWNRVFGITRVDAGMPDPVLTPEGEAATLDAARRVAAELTGDLRPVRILASPYRRTLQTAALLARTLDLPIIVEPLIRERCAFSCDQGTVTDELAATWPDLDFGALEQRWWGRAIESMESLDRRAATFLQSARAMPDRDRTLAVSHWGFIRSVTGAEVDNLAMIRVPALLFGQPD